MERLERASSPRRPSSGPEPISGACRPAAPTDPGQTHPPHIRGPEMPCSHMACTRKCSSTTLRNAQCARSLPGFILLPVRLRTSVLLVFLCVVPVLQYVAPTGRPSPETRRRFAAPRGGRRRSCLHAPPRYWIGGWTGTAVDGRMDGWSRSVVGETYVLARVGTMPRSSSAATCNVQCTLAITATVLYLQI
jgi:hypothetical protein